MKLTVTLRVLIVFALAWTVVPLQATGPTSSAGDINSRFETIYVDLLAKEGRPVPISGDVDALIQNLAQLRDLDPDIRAFGPGIGDAFLRTQANRYRALAWLHGWAIFSRLAIESSAPDAPLDARDRLIELSATAARPSALALLLTVYRQINREDGTTEPLRHILQDGTLLVLNLSYHEAWHNDRPPHITHPYYIPSTADLIGTSASSTSLDRHLITVWGLINLELDTWQTFATEAISSTALPALAAHPLVVRQADGTRGFLRANSTNLSPLISWFSDVQTNLDLPYLEGNGTTTLIPRLLLRLQKIATFLRVRQHYSNKDNLGDIFTKLSSITLQPDKDLSSVIGDLLSAASPIEEAGKQEVLYDAAIWLRYVMLLAYRNQGDSAVGSGGNSLQALWILHHLPQSFTLTQEGAAISLAPQGAILRWNQWPSSGTLATVLADLTRAGYGYLDFRRIISANEDTRIKSLGSVQAQMQYAQQLDQALQAFRTGSIDVLSPYFLTPGSGAPTPENVAPTSLADRDGALAFSFRRTSTISEQARLVDDLSALYSQARSEFRFNELVLSAYRTSDPVRISGTLQAIGAIVPTAKWNIYSLPGKTFNDYRADLKAALEPLNRELTAIDAQNELGSLFGERQKHYENAQAAVAAARLGREVAAQALAIDLTYKKIADLDSQIGDLREKIKGVDILFAEKKEQAEALRLEYTTRLRDLAAAKIEALVAASEQANQMVDKATSNLKDLQGKLKQTAQHIKADKNHAAIMSIVSSVISVVGVALAPVTGGASIGIASLVAKAVSVIDDVSKDPVNWKDLPGTLAKLQKVGAVFSEGFKLASVPITSELRGAIADCNKFFGSTKASFDKISADAQNIIATLKTLPSPDEINRYASAIASGFPVVIDASKKTVAVAFGKTSMVLESPALMAAVSNVIDSGGMIVNDARNRAEEFGGLLSLSDPELTDQLKKSLDSLIRPLPDSFPLPPGVTNTVDDAKRNFRKAIDQLDSLGQRNLAKMLANGMIFVRADDKSIVAVQNAANEVEGFKDRLKKYREGIENSAIKNASDRIKVISADINGLAQGFIANKDDDGLENFAKVTLPAKIDGLQDELKAIQDKINTARYELEDEKTKVSIASYDADAARYFVQATKLRGEEAALQARKAGFSRDAAAARIEQAGVEAQQQDALVDIAVRSEEIARISLQRTYLQCLARGFNPLATLGNERIDYQYSALSIRSVVAGSSEAKSIHKDLNDAVIAGDLAGMMQWVYLLGVNSPGRSDRLTPLYLETIRALQKTDLDGIRRASTDLESYFSEAAATSVTVLFDTALKLDQEISWLDEMSGTEKRSWLEPINRQVTPRQLSSVLAVVQISFSLDGDQASKTTHVPTPHGNSSYYMKLENTSVVVPNVDLVNNMTYVLLPPANPTSSSSDLMAGSGLADSDSGRSILEGQIHSDLVESLLLSDIEREVKSWTNLHLSGSIGTWTFYILSSASKSPDDLARLKRDWKMTIRMPYLEVRHAAR
jgi:hypothetical protein